MIWKAKSLLEKWWSEAFTHQTALGNYYSLQQNDLQLVEEYRIQQQYCTEELEYW